MTKKAKVISLSVAAVIGFIIIFLALMTWFFPYSSFSMKKSMTYSPDPFVVEGYVADLNEFKEIYEADKASEEMKNLKIDRTQYILPIFEQKWLVNKESITIDKLDFDTMLFDVVQARQILLSLMVQEDYTTEQKQYLADLIENLLALEDSISEIQHSPFVTRSTLDHQIRELQGGFEHSLSFFAMYYERS
ncbi:hypothetical protein [Ornithinibacillus halophilus]|uniref:Uncharacterized protein n=1 Tax=Ornithinibacillus halophilus TaxID=930117 RepID=A0A1M5K0Z9_9BACI|nr:hypothetical protein [Ornithinibacillus halophilus]SHG45973.1 hypothetical protein SAMN05216225_103435 [Ornithinibacillus halophilus]